MMDKRKILFFIYEMGAGGAARTLLNILNHLDREKFEPILVTLNYNGSYEEHLKDDVTFIKLETRRLRSAIFPLAKVIRHEQPDIVFSTIPNYNIIAIVARLLSFTKTKNVVREAALLGDGHSFNMKLIMYGLFYRLSSKVISLSEGVKTNLVEHYKVKHDNVKVIYNPIDIKHIQSDADHGAIAKEHEHIFATNRKVIITAGRLVGEKDHKTLIRAFAKVNEQLDSKLVLLGEGSLKDDLKELTKQVGIEQHVHFIGFQQNPYVYFKQADLFVLSSLSEGFGHVLVEALAMGIPIVSTNCGPGAQEVLKNGTYGAICQVGNDGDMAKKMIDVLTLPKEETEKVIEKGLQRVQEFAVKEIVAQYEQTFIEIIDRG